MVKWFVFQSWAFLFKILLYIIFPIFYTFHSYCIYSIFFHIFKQQNLLFTKEKILDKSIYWTFDLILESSNIYYTQRFMVFCPFSFWCHSYVFCVYLLLFSYVCSWFWNITIIIATLGSILDSQLSWESCKFQLARWSHEVALFSE